MPPAPIHSLTLLVGRWHSVGTAFQGTNKGDFDIFVSRINPDTPAAASKLRVGDRIVSVNESTV